MSRIFSNLSVTTRHTSASVGTRLDYDPSGRITSRARCAREVGGATCME